MVLFVILTGIWIGSLLGSACDRRLRRPLALFAVAIALFVASTLGALAYFDAYQVMAHRGALFLRSPPTTDFGWVLATQWTVLRPTLLVVGLPILFLGAAFPLANAHVQRLAASVGQRAGALYLANTAGAVAGSLAAGFLLLPALGTQRATLVVVAAALLAVAALQARAVERARGLAPQHRRVRGLLRAPARWPSWRGPACPRTSCSSAASST